MTQFRIGTLSKLTNVSIETIRYYERLRLIESQGRSQSGYRIFTDNSVKRILFIKQAKNLGFTLKEIKELLDLKMVSDLKCSIVKDRALKKLVQLDNKIDALNEMKTAIQKLITLCDGKSPVKECKIIDLMENNTSSLFLENVRDSE